MTFFGFSGNWVDHRWMVKFVYNDSYLWIRAWCLIRYYVMVTLVATALGRIMQACPYSSLDIRDVTETHYERGNDNQRIS